MIDIRSEGRIYIIFVKRKNNIFDLINGDNMKERSLQFIEWAKIESKKIDIATIDRRKSDAIRHCASALFFCC